MKKHYTCPICENGLKKRKCELCEKSEYILEQVESRQLISA